MTELGEIPVEWNIEYLENIAQRLSGHTPDKKVDEYWNGDIPWISLKDTKRLDKRYISETTDYTTEEGINNSSAVMLPKGTVVLSRDATVGKVGITDKKMATSQHFINYVCGEKLHNLYLYYDFYNRKPLFERIGAGSTIKTIGVPFFKSLGIILPPIKEQQKIADILSTVDDQIENANNLIEKTKELKKGLMQKLLTKGIGHGRFKDTEIGKIPEKWEVTNLIDISQGKGEYGIGAVATEYVVGNPRYLRITDIGDESRLLFNDIKGLDDVEYEKYILKHNDIVFARTGNTTGKSYVYNTQDGDLVYAGFLIKFSINPKLANVNFIKYVIQSKRYWDWVNVMSTRSGQPGINSNEYAKLLIQVPSIEEQNQIALVISSVDEKIEQYELKKEKLQELKKGLMQKLLTGKVRVS